MMRVADKIIKLQQLNELSHIFYTEALTPYSERGSVWGKVVATNHGTEWLPKF